MAEYNPADLPQPTLSDTSSTSRAARVRLTPNGTLAHLAALYTEGAGAFTRIAAANGVFDPIPYEGPPPRAVRRISLLAGQELVLPETEI